MLKGKLYLENQECEGNYDFINITESYMTRGFAKKFGDEAKEIFSKALWMIDEKYSNTADYLQSFVYELGDKKEDKIRFWMILNEYKNGVHIVTALLPEEY